MAACLRQTKIVYMGSHHDGCLIDGGSLIRLQLSAVSFLFCICTCHFKSITQVRSRDTQRVEIRNKKAKQETQGEQYGE